jgi:hypothetical protein
MSSASEADAWRRVADLRLAFFIVVAFARVGEAGRDESNRRNIDIAIGKDNNDTPAAVRSTEENEAFLADRMNGVRHCHGPIVPNAVLASSKLAR